jgi:hypothetical protein
MHFPARHDVFRARLSGRRGRAGLGLLFVVGLLSGAPATASARQGARQSVVLLTPRARPAAAQHVIRAAWAQLSDVPVDLRVVRVARIPRSPARQLARARRAGSRASVVAVFWVDTSREVLRILLCGRGGDRLVTRPLGEASSEGHAETIAVILRTTVRAHRQGRSVGRALPPPEPRRRASSPPAPKGGADVGGGRANGGARTERAARMGLELAGATDLFAQDRLRLGTGLRVGLLVHLVPRWAVFAAYRLEAPMRVSESEVASLQIRRHPVELGARFCWSSGRFSLGARLALGLLVLDRDLALLDSDYLPLEAGPDLQLTVTPSLLVAFRPTRRLAVVLELGVRILAVGNRPYTLRALEQEDPDVLLVDPLVAQPQIRLGLEVDLF